MVLATRNAVGNSDYIATLYVTWVLGPQYHAGELGAAEWNSLQQALQPQLHTTGDYCAETGGRQQSHCLPLVYPQPIQSGSILLVNIYIALVVSTMLPENATTPGRFLRFYTFHELQKCLSPVNCYLNIWLSVDKQLTKELGYAIERSGIYRSNCGGQGFHLVVKLKGAKGTDSENEDRWGPCKHSPSSSKL